MKKKGRMTLFISLVCIGIIGVLILKNGQDDEAAIAIQDKEALSQGVVDDQGQANETDTGIVDEPNQDSQNTDNKTTDEKDSQNDSNNDQDEQINSSEDVTNDATQHIDINMEEIIALVGEHVYNFDSEKISRISNPSSRYVLVNKKNDLPSDYVPDDLVIPDITFSFEGDNPKKQMRLEAADALELLFKGAQDQGLYIYAVSGYRSYSKQETIYKGNVSSMGEAAANSVSAKPGQSEHQTGLAMDISCQSAGFDLVEEFGETDEGIWLAAHAQEYGFIIRYPEDKIEITQYNYEPWHVRYVGVTLATHLYESDMTLDQFYEQLVN